MLFAGSTFPIVNVGSLFEVQFLYALKKTVHEGTARQSHPLVHYACRVLVPWGGYNTHKSRTSSSSCSLARRRCDEKVHRPLLPPCFLALADAPGCRFPCVQSIVSQTALLAHGRQYYGKATYVCRHFLFSAAWHCMSPIAPYHHAHEALHLHHRRLVYEY